MTGPKPYERTTYAGKILTEKRRQMGISQQRLSSMTGLSLRVYQRLETGEMDFRDTRMKFGLALCTILGLDPYCELPIESNRLHHVFIINRNAGFSTEKRIIYPISQRRVERLLLNYYPFGLPYGIRITTKAPYLGTAVIPYVICPSTPGRPAWFSHRCS